MDTKPQNKVLRIMKIALNTFFYIVVILLLTFSLANIKVKTENDIPNIFGRGFLSVQSDSMKSDAEDAFEKGDMIFVRMLNDDSRNDIKEGDVVTFFDRAIRAFNTHRVIELFELEGKKYLVTQGDNTPGSDQPILLSDVIAVYRSSWSGFGETLTYLQSPVGFALFIILPVVFILVYEGIGLTRNILALNKAKMKEQLDLDKEEALKSFQAEKEKIRAQVIEELKKEQETKK
ncbi:MAG: signal peptidase I [Acholeplasmataceae bacterium]|nr:signal peptidase I [Acholeplasmataceae bacterium]